MKVWVVCKADDYEGFRSPSGVFSSKRKAEAFEKKLNKEGGSHDAVFVWAYVVDDQFSKPEGLKI